VQKHDQHVEQLGVVRRGVGLFLLTKREKKREDIVVGNAFVPTLVVVPHPTENIHGGFLVAASVSLCASGQARRERVANVPPGSL
jgi:hypothetical protein|tara:strand:+ start:308 stop:562 length:255 start_codon:yes stop_codon:yes gene_type:complete